MLTPTQKRNLSRILPFGLIWGFFGLLYVQIEYGILGDTAIYPSTNNLYESGASFFFISFGSFIIGILIGTIEVVLMTKLCLGKSFLQKLLFKTAIYLSAIVLLTLIIALLATSARLDRPLFDPTVLQSMLQYASNFAFLSIVIYAGAIALLSLFILEISNYLGIDMLTNFFTGKYHLPHEEERIFMFLDMKSSTVIAEKLGNMDYFQLLNRFYADATDAIIDTSGEVYQYVGDEIIVSWNLKEGLANRNCIRCFFLIKETFRALAQSYLNRFQMVPEFKAGFHCGKVTTGEIGVLKKEILFTGDVLNTTSRIQSSCSDYLTDMLISIDLLSQLEIGDAYELSEMGECQLKGKKEKIDLYSLSKIDRSLSSI